MVGMQSVGLLERPTEDVAGVQEDATSGMDAGATAGDALGRRTGRLASRRSAFRELLDLGIVFLLLVR